MNCNDFLFLWRGKRLASLADHQIHLLNAIDIRRRDNGRALLLLHGFSSSPAVYRELIPALTSYDALCCPKLPGHADSLSSFAKTHATDWIDVANNACAELLESYEEVDVMGLSLGGVLACQLAHRFRLHRLYLLAPALDLRLPIGPVLNCILFLHKLGFKVVRNRAGNLCSAQFPELAYRQLPVSAIIEVLQYIKDYEWSAPDCPVDLFLGHHDDVVDSMKVAARFSKISNTCIHWLPESAHLICLDNNRQQIIDCVIKNNQKN
ncbi:MAG: alpha/beta hydrolase [Legionella sp.]